MSVAVSRDAPPRKRTLPLDDPRVRAEVVALLYGNAAVGVIMNLLSVPVIWLVYHRLTEATPLVLLLTVWAGLQVLSAWNRRQWNRLTTATQQEPAVSAAFLFRARAMAWVLSIGMAILLAYLHYARLPASPSMTAVLGLIYVFGASIATLIYLAQIRIFSSVVLGSQALLLAWSANPIEWLLAGMFIALIVGVLIYGRRYSAQLQQVIVLRFDVQDLLSEQARLRDLAEAANAAKSRFFAAASHDVRQPLQAVMLTFHALKFARDDQRRARLLDDAERNLTALRQLFDQVLDISKIDAGAVPIKIQAVALQPVFEKLEARFNDEAISKKLWLRFVPTLALVASDPDALERILANLIGNAIKHTERGGVWIAYRTARGRVEVRDSGVGIAREHHEKIFEEFFQVDNPGRDRASGLGLGLSIVQRLAALLHHSIGLASAPQHGTTFWVSAYPPDAAIAQHSLTVDIAHSEARATPANEGESGHQSLAGLSIFLVENDAQVARAMTDLLVEAGAYVQTFLSADEALATAPANLDVNTVISDFRLGSALDGVDVVLGLRAIWQRDVGAIVLTGDTAIKDLARIDSRLKISEAHTQMQARTRLMHKPVSASQMIDALRAMNVNLPQ